MSGIPGNFAVPRLLQPAEQELRAFEGLHDRHRFEEWRPCARGSSPRSSPGDIESGSRGEYGPPFRREVCSVRHRSHAKCARRGRRSVRRRAHRARSTGGAGWRAGSAAHDALKRRRRCAGALPHLDVGGRARGGCRSHKRRAGPSGVEADWMMPRRAKRQRPADAAGRNRMR